MVTAVTDVDTAPGARADDEWDAAIAPFTGAMAPDGLEPFAGSERLRPDGRPRRELRDELRRIPDARNAVAVVTTLIQPPLVAWAALHLDHPVTWMLAVLVMGTFFARLAALHHEGAHRLLCSNRRINDAVGVVVLGWLGFGDCGDTYRRVHAAHHRDEMGPREPDLGLYARYPVTRSSMRRKLTRDALGVSGYKNLKPALVGLWRPERRARALRTLAGMAVTFAAYALAGVPWLWVALWLLPWLCVWRVINRLRAIAEHGGMTRSADRRRTTHDVRQHLLARLTIVPYNIGYHLAHHVDSGIPWTNLPRLHDVLVADGYARPDQTWSSYPALWRALARGRGDADAEVGA